VEQEEDQEVCGAGGGSCDLESRRMIMWSRRRIRWSGEQEEDQVVWRAGGGSGGLGSRGTQGGSSNQCIGRVEMHFKWRSISLRSSIFFSVNFFLFALLLTFSSFFQIS
jgi:hypothetical protein